MLRVAVGDCNALNRREELCRLYAMTEPAKPEVICTVCSTPGTGRFCSACGASLEATTCASCGTSLSPGAKFCHRCGHAAGRPAATPLAAVPPAPNTVANSLPWIVAAIALITLLAFFAGSAFNKRRGSTLDAPQNALPQAGLDDRVPSGDASAEGAVRGPDISQLSPQERADRLFNRVMLLAGEGKTDSVLFFAPMAINAYQMLSPMNADQRYDMGRIAEVAGALPLAQAQADSILSESPTHLLGLVLAARIAALNKDETNRKALNARIVSAYQAESAKRLPEYERHAADISSALDEARRSAGTR